MRQEPKFGRIAGGADLKGWRLGFAVVSAAASLGTSKIWNAAEALPANRARLMNGALEGWSFSSDINRRREAHPSCAASSAQAFRYGAAETPLSSETSSNHDSPITNHNAFLIDTPAIRIAPNPFACNTQVRSNRHSSGASRLHQNCAISG